MAILLATRNGARYLDAQLASLERQDVAAIDIFASDDASTDTTRDLLARWRERWRRGRFEVASGPGSGFSENFRALLGRPDSSSTHIAFCDQDDIWDPDKLSTAIAALGPAGDRPGLYCSRTRLIDAEGTVAIGLSPHFRRPPQFRNAIVQSIAGGNTMVLNRPGYELVAEASRRTGFVSHDWWSYQIVSGAGGYVYYDPVPHIGYRQHDANVVGDNLGLWAKMRRLRLTLTGRFAEWNETNLRALGCCADLLTADSRAVIDAFGQLRRAPALRRMLGLRRLGLYRQTVWGDFSLAVAALLGKL